MKYTLMIEASEPHEIVALLANIGAKPEVAEEKPARKTKAKPAPEPEPEEVDDDPEEEITIEKIRATAATKSQNGMKEEVKALLAKFKVARITDLKPAQYQKFYDALNDL